MEKKTYHPLVEKFLEEIPSTVKAAKENSDFLYFVDKIKEEFKEFYMSAWTYAQIRKVEMVFQFPKFSDAKRLLKFMAENGQRRQGKVIEMKDLQTMIWNFDRFQIKGTFKEEGGTCHYVKTGTKMVEVPVYELQCPEVLDPTFQPVQVVKEVDGDGLPF